MAQEIVLPKTLGLCADRLYALAQAKRALHKQLEELEREESTLKTHIIDNLSKQDATGATGRVAKARILIKEIPTVRDWDAFYAFVHKHKAYQLLQRRLATAAVGELMQDNTVPGVEIFNAIVVSVTKA